MRKRYKSFTLTFFFLKTRWRLDFHTTGTLSATEDQSVLLVIPQLTSLNSYHSFHIKSRAPMKSKPGSQSRSSVSRKNLPFYLLPLCKKNMQFTATSTFTLPQFQNKLCLLMCQKLINILIFMYEAQLRFLGPSAPQSSQITVSGLK